MTEKQLRDQVVKTAVSFLGANEADGSHKKIIDIYNAHKPLARGYKVKHTDAWCATFVSAVSIQTGLTDIIPTECGCEQQVKLFQKLGAWVENDAHTPQPGDVIFYDWQDSGKGDNKGYTDHVGIVVSVANGKVKIIEGNYNDKVAYRTLSLNGKTIRGYGVPKYSTKATPDKTEPAKSEGKADPAQSFDKALAGTYKVTAPSGLNLRDGAGTSGTKVLTARSYGSTVQCYGYYTEHDGVKWLYVVAGGQTGFMSSEYLARA